MWGALIITVACIPRRRPGSMKIRRRHRHGGLEAGVHMQVVIISMGRLGKRLFIKIGSDGSRQTEPRCYGRSICMIKLPPPSVQEHRLSITFGLAQKSPLGAHDTHSSPPNQPPRGGRPPSAPRNRQSAIDIAIHVRVAVVNGILEVTVRVAQRIADRDTRPPPRAGAVEPGVVLVAVILAVAEVGARVRGAVGRGDGVAGTAGRAGQVVSVEVVAVVLVVDGPVAADARAGRGDVARRRGGDGLRRGGRGDGAGRAGDCGDVGGGCGGCCRGGGGMDVDAVAGTGRGVVGGLGGGVGA